ncbi:hypothetical protein SFMTTN_0030 [Sulfuriferula multivorans]|uniref:Uncharacterized protein n=1 Tax=Sulfuriferula multivorans TaxID=1559896 RepID=A0A401J989_9PROT|nr:hypothetical protein [Sulfuriferula multivorans]GBL44235.1 hypothetical protein SFMTTN_0030 [Sulfuriferula multivorans]
MENKDNGKAEVNQPTISAGEPSGVSEARRRFSKIGLTGSAVIFTLASRPVWAGQCSISGMMSGNVSSPGQITCAGCTPGFWKNNHVDTTSHDWIGTGYKTTETFNSVFGVEKYKITCNPTLTHVYTLYEVLWLQGSEDPLFPELGAHAVAALLNAASFPDQFGYTASEILQLFRNATNHEELKNMLAILNQRDCPISGDSGSQPEGTGFTCPTSGNGNSH